MGGHEDFTGGAARGLRGRSLVCLPSTANGANDALISRIVPTLPPGVVATTPRHQLDVVVTEHGAAELAGRSVQERAAALIAVAAPELRDELREQFARLTHAKR